MLLSPVQWKDRQGFSCMDTDALSLAQRLLRVMYPSFKKIYAVVFAVCLEILGYVFSLQILSYDIKTLLRVYSCRQLELERALLHMPRCTFEALLCHRTCVRCRLGLGSSTIPCPEE